MWEPPLPVPFTQHCFNLCLLLRILVFTARPASLLSADAMANAAAWLHVGDLGALLPLFTPA